MKEIEGYELKENDKRTTVSPIGGSITCNYREPKDKHIHGQFCFWGYEDSLGQTQCKYFKGTKSKIIDDVETTIIKCLREKKSCGA